MSTRFSRAKSFFKRKDNIRMLALLFPGLAVIGLFTFYPIIKMFVMSFFDWKIGYQQVSQFAGLKNYAAVFSDKAAGIAIANTFYYMLLTVPLQMIIGLLVRITSYNVCYTKLLREHTIVHLRSVSELDFSKIP